MILLPIVWKSGGNTRKGVWCTHVLFLSCRYVITIKIRLFCIHMSILTFQFILPIVLISWAHHAIKQKLQKLPSWSKNQENSIIRRRSSCKPEYPPALEESHQNGISRLSKLRESVMKGKRRQSNVSTSCIDTKRP